VDSKYKSVDISNCVIHSIQNKTECTNFPKKSTLATYTQYTDPTANVDTVVPRKANVTIAPKFLKNDFCKKYKNT